MRNVPSLETVYRDYSAKGVKFYYLYKALAHPGLNGYIRPHTLEERLMHIEEAKRTLGSEIPWLADSMENELRHAIGNAPNSEYVLDPEGKVARMRRWSDPQTLRQDLAELVGPVEEPTQLSDLNLETAPPPKLAPTGVVPRLRRQGRFQALIAKPQLGQSEDPFYVKLRAEADRDLLNNGKGKLYLGFFLDPLYEVHWNNEVAPVRYEVFAPNGITLAPKTSAGPEIEEDADADPREFLLEAERGDSSEPLRLVFHYFACTEKWCKPVTQEYALSWEVDRDAGRPRGQGWGRFGGFGGRGGPGFGGPGGPGPGRRGPGGRGPGRGPGGPGGFLTRMMEFDLDGDDRVTRDELPERMQRRFEFMDANQDGFLDDSDMEEMRNRFREGRGRGGRGRGPRGPRNDGPPSREL